MNSKSKGVFYPAIDSLVSALDQRESVIKNFENIKEDYRRNMRKLRTANLGEHLDSDDDEY